MCENDIALFKRALVEGLSNKIDREISKCKEDIVVSPAHDRVMNEIITAAERKSSRSARFKKIIAILVAAALLLTGCAVIYRDEIRSFIEEIYETFVKVNYNEDKNGEGLEYFYELTYIPEGYSLEFSIQETIKVKYVFTNSNGDKIAFMQSLLDTRNFYIDIENGYTKLVNISRYDMYYKCTKGRKYYLWNDGKYMFSLISDIELPTDELNLIMEGIK